MKNVLFIGDPILDVYHYGEITRLNPEGPWPLVDITSCHRHRGGVENVYCSCFNMLHNLSKCHIRLIDGGTSTAMEVKNRYVVNNTVLLRTDSRTTQEQREAFGAEVARRFLALSSDNWDIIAISDYNKGAITPQLLDLLSEYHIAHPDTFIAIDPKSIDYRLFGESRWRDMFDLIKPNEKCLSNADPEIESVLLCDWVTSKGKDGVIINQFFEDGCCLTTEIPAERTDGDLVDTCSCGDSLFAGIISGFVLGLSLVNAVKLGNFLAARTASKFGSYYNTEDEIRFFVTNRLGLSL